VIAPTACRFEGMSPGCVPLTILTFTVRNMDEVAVIIDFYVRAGLTAVGRMLDDYTLEVVLS
jgi:hypothetical protein